MLHAHKYWVTTTLSIIWIISPSNSRASQESSRTWQFSSTFLQNQKPNTPSNSPSSELKPTIPSSPPSHHVQNVIPINSPYPYIPSIAHTHQPPNPPPSLFTYENAYTALNVATMSYVAYEIYRLYTAMINPSQAIKTDESSFIIKAFKEILLFLCPQFLQNIGRIGLFFIDSFAIVVQALLYKTIAKLIILCGQGDIVDLLGLRKIHHTAP